MYVVKPVFFKLGLGHEVQRPDMGGLQYHRRRSTGFQCLAPAVGAQAPAVARLESGKSVFWLGRDQVVTAFFRERQKIRGHPDADQMRAEVGCVGVAAAVAEITSQRIVGTGDQIGAQHVFGGHVIYQELPRAPRRTAPSEHSPLRGAAQYTK